MAIKRILFLFFLSIPMGVFGQRYWVASSSGNWNNSSNWSTTSGGSGGASVPGASDVVIFNGASGKNGTCNITTDITIAGLSLIGYTGQINVSSSDLSITGAATFNTGQINATGTGSTLTVNTSAATNFAGTIFSIPTTITTGGLNLNGSTFNSTLAITRTGPVSTSLSQGGNTFNGATSFTNTGAAMQLAVVNPDRYNGNVTFSNIGPGFLTVGVNSTGNQFNGNIIVNCTAGTGIQFNNATGSSTLASGKTITVGALGFSTGALTLKGFTQTGATPTTLTLTGSAVVSIGGSSVFNGNVSILAPAVLLNGAQYNGTLSIEKTGTIGTAGNGGNTFNGAVTIKNSSSLTFATGNGSPDIFNADVSLNSAAPGGVIYLAFNSTGTQFKGNIIVESSGAGIVIGTGSSTLAAGKAIQVGPAGFSTGSLTLGNFTQLGTSPFNLTLTGTVNLFVQNGCVFGGSVSFISPAIFLNGATFNSTAYFERTGSVYSAGAGGNIFNGLTTIKNSGDQNFGLGNATADIFNKDVRLINSGPASLFVALGGAGHQFNGNISIESSSTGSIQVGPGSSVLASGKMIQVGPGGFSTGGFYLYNFTQTGTTPVNLTLTGSTVLVPGTGTVFNGPVSFVVPSVQLNGATYNNSAYIESTVSQFSSGTGGDTFNGSATIKNSGVYNFALGQTSPETFNGDVTLASAGSNNSALYVGNKSGTLFNGDIIIESTSGSGVFIGNGSSTLASGRTIKIGPAGFSTGTFYVFGLTQLGANPINIALSGTATIKPGTGTVFNAPVSFVAPSVQLDGATYNNSAYFESTVSQFSSCAGGDTFNAATTIKNTGVHNFSLGQLSPEIFNGDVTLVSSGATGAAVTVGNKSGTQFNGNIIFESTSGAGVTIGAGSSTLASGKTMSVGPAGFSAGALFLYNFTQLGTTPVSLTLTGNSGIILQPTCVFNAAVAFTAPGINLNSATFNNTAYFEKTGASADFNTGGNLFKGVTTVKNSGSGPFVLAANNADRFFQNVTFQNTGTSAIYPAYATGDNIFDADIDVQSTAGGGIIFCGTADGSAVLSSGKIFTGAGGFTAGGLVLRRFSQLGSQSINLVQTGSAYLTVGPATTFTADVTATSPGVYLNGATFKSTALINKNGVQVTRGTGGNIFDGTVTINNSGTGSIQSNGSDLFNNTVNLVNASTGNIAMELVTGSTYNSTLSLTNQSGVVYVAYAGTTNFNDNIIVNSTGGFGIYFGFSSSSSSTLKSGKTITVGPSGFTAGELWLAHFTQSGSTSQAITLGNNAGFRTGPATTWNANVNFSGGKLFLDGTTFMGTALLSKTGSGSDRSIGGNTFSSDVTFNVSSTSVLLANTTGDAFQANVVFNISNAAKIYPAFNGNSTFTGNITAQNIDASAVDLNFGFSSIGGTGTTTLNGPADQAITSNFTPTFARLILDKPSGVVNLNTPVNIGINATFTSGILNATSVNFINFTNGSSFTGGSDASFVNGPVRKTGNNAFTFPTGSSSGGSNVFRSVSMSAPSAATEVFVAQYFRQPQAFGGVNTYQSPIVAVSGCEYFSFTRTTGSSSPKLTISWRRSDCASDLFTSDQTKHVVSRWTGSNWISEGNSATTGGATAGTVTSNAVTGFGNFAIGYTGILSNSLTFTACSDASVGFFPSSDVLNATYTWTRAAVAGVSPGAASGTGNISEVLTNSTSSPIVVTYQVVTSTASASSAPELLTVTLNPSPVLTSALTGSPICSASSFVYNPTSSLPSTTFTWSRPAVSGISQSANSGTNSVNEQLNNTTTDPVSVIYNYTLSANGCDVPQVVTVVVKPSPQLSTSLTPPAICSTNAFAYTLSSATAGATFSWTRSSVTGITQGASSGTTTINEPLTNSTAFPITVPYVVITSANGCNNGPSGQTVSVVVNPTPQLTSALNPATVCSNNVFAYTPTSLTSGTTYAWSRASVAGISQSSSNGTGAVSEPLTNTTTNPVSVAYDFTLSANGCTNDQIVTVAVNPTPVLTSVLTPAPICSSTTFSYTPASSLSGTTYSWSRPAVTGISQSAGTGTGSINEQITNTTAAPVSVVYNYNLTASGCSAPASITVLVNPTPQLNTSLTPAAICSGSSFGYNFTSATTGAAFTWSRSSISGINEGPSNGTSAINEQLTNATASPVTVPYLVITSANGCNNAPTGQTISVVVNPTPQLSSLLAPASTCSNNTFTYTPTSLTSGTTYSWTRASVLGISQSSATGTGSVSEQLTNTTTSPISVTYNFTLGANGCSNVQNVIATVNPTPVLSSVINPAAICSSTTFAYSPTSAVAGTAFSWSRPVIAGINESAGSGAGSVSEQLTNTGTSPVSVIYNYTLTANSCSNPQTVTVVVNPTPQLNSSLTPPAICSTSSFVYGLSSATSGATFAWSRASVTGISEAASNGTSAINEQLTNATASAITVPYVVISSANGCNNGPSGQTVSVVVNPTPQLSSTSTPAAVCSNSAFVYTPASLTTGTTFSWSRAAVLGISQSAGNGIGSINEQLNNTTSDPVSVVYNFTLTASSCSAPQTVTVVINPTPQLSSSLTPAAICSSSAFTYNFSSATTGVTYSWTRSAVTGISEGSDSGSGSVNEQLTNSTAAPVTVPYVVITSANGCTNGPTGQTVSVVVNPTPQLNSALSVGAICSTNTFGYTPTSSTSGTSFSWNRPSITGISQASSNGAGSISESLTNTTSNPITVSYDFALLANGCTNDQVVTVVVNPTPVLTSLTSASAICSATTFAYSPTSSLAATTYSWTRPSVVGISESAGAGTGSVNEQLNNITPNPVSVTYNYNMTASGCSASQSVTVVVNPTPQLSTSLTPPAICSGSLFGYNFSSETIGTSYSWSRASLTGINEGASNGTASIVELLTNATSTPVTVPYTVITSANGCNNGPLGQTVSVIVNPTPQLLSALSAAAICSNNTFTYAPSSATSGTTYSWSRASVSGISQSASSGTGSVSEQLTNTTSNVVNVTYSFTIGANGCSNNQNVTTTVNPTPALSSLLNPAAICSNTAFAYTPTSQVSGTTFSWSRPLVTGISEATGAGTGSVSEQLTNTTANPVSVTYNYTLTANSCSNPQVVTVVVNPTPQLNTSLTALPVCSGSSMVYSFGSATAGATYAWSRASLTGITETATNGTSNINEQLTNSTNTAITVPYVVITSANGCNNGPSGEVVSVVVNPTPQLISVLNPAPICSAATFSYTPSALPAGTTYSWIRPNTPGIKEGLSTSSGPISEVLTNQTTQTLDVTYNFVLLANGCSKNQSITVSVNPNPVLSSSLAQAICSGDLLQSTLTSATTGSSFNWSRSIVAGISQAASSGAGAQIAEVLTNTTPQSVNVPYIITTSVNGCSNAGEQLLVTVKPRPTVSSLLSGAICSGGTFNYTPVSLTDNTTFAWSRGAKSGITPLTSSGQGDISETLTNSTGNAIHVNYSIVPTYSGCEGTTASLDLKIGAIPTLTITSPPPVCPDQKADLTNPSITVGSDPGLQFSYFADANLTAPVSNPSNLTAEGTYYIQGTNGDGCVKALPVTITFKTVGELTSSRQVQATCSPATFDYTPTASIPGSTFTWSRLANDLILESPSTGSGVIHEETLTNTGQATATVQYLVVTSTGQCSNLGDIVEVPVLPIPVLSSTLDAGTVSNGDQFTYEPASLVSGSSFEWSRPAVAGVLEAANSGQGTIAEMLHNTTSTAIEVLYSVIVTASGCTGPEEFVKLMVGPYETVKIPEGFSPNGDGVNDTFEIINTSGFPSEVKIFDRWGKLLYSSDNYQNDWSGGTLPNGTYFSVVKVGSYLKKHALTIHR